ncbi:hypothetical protein N0824_01760 [Microcystis sp. 0824]|nr:hypothetical protein N0824_01760 [Microcystis sp. 0824]
MLDLYKNQYIAYNEKGVIADGENLQNVLEEANTTNQEFVIYLVPSCRYSIQILPIQV